MKIIINRLKEFGYKKISGSNVYMEYSFTKNS